MLDPADSTHASSRVVLHVARDPFTGVWSVIKTLCTAQARRGYKVHLGLLASKDWYHWDELKSLPCERHVVESPRLFGTAAFTYHSFRSPVAAWYKMLRANDANCVIHYHNSWLSGALCLRDQGVPQVVTFHGYQAELEGQPVRRFIHRSWARRLMARECVLASVDVRSCGVFDSILGVPAEAFTVVPNGFAAPESIRERTKRNDVLMVGYAGAIDENKGWRIAAEAVRSLAREGIKIRLLIAGLGRESDAAERWCAENSECAEFRGYVRNAGWAFMPNLDAFVLPSRKEGMPMAVIEAMASGVVVICTAAGGLPEVVADGKTGFIIERSSEHIAKRLRDLAMDDALRERMSKAARRAYREKFSDEAMCSAYEQVYDSALQL